MLFSRLDSFSTITSVVGRLLDVVTTLLFVGDKYFFIDHILSFFSLFLSFFQCIWRLSKTPDNTDSLAGPLSVATAAALNQRQCRELQITAEEGRTRSKCLQVQRATSGRHELVKEDYKRS